MAERVAVMISSTARDLPDHRKQAIEAILRMSMLPIAMEYLPAKSEDAIDASLAMVDEAQIYLGIVAQRYGYIPDNPKNPDKVSITEMEFRRAIERDIPRLIFVMGDNHLLTPNELETSPEGAAKLLRFKNELTTNYIVKFFNSTDELREQIITSLATSPFRKADSFTTVHYISDIPKPPEPYVAHPYTLLQTSKLVGRQKELNLLTDWVATPASYIYQARILNIVAIGGMGKSALTWKWFKEIAPQEMKPMAGAIWWSFYESDARFENFVIRTLAYMTGRTREDIEQKTNPIERESALLKALNDKPYLIVMDGFEKLLVAYARMDASFLSDDDLDEQTANRVVGALGLPESAGQAFVSKHQLRKTTDPRIGNFLRKLASVKRSRILISTRLYPADLQTITGSSIPNSYAYFLKGLGDNEALELWDAMGVNGSRDTLLPLFKSFENYPLLIRILAGEVARFRHAPGDFDSWRKVNPNFNPFRVEMTQVKSHVLAYALQGLDEKERKVLHTIAAFRMPVGYNTLVALMVGENKPYMAEIELDDVLVDLEDRGILGWDKSANRYDLHPIVRGVIWSKLNESKKVMIYKALRKHFAYAANLNWQDIDSLLDVEPTIELYNSLIGLKRYDDATRLFYKSLGGYLIFHLGASNEQMQLAQLLFTPTDDCLASPQFNEYLFFELAHACHFNGQLYRAISLFKKSIERREGSSTISANSWSDISEALFQSGSIRQAELAIRSALILNNHQVGANLSRWCRILSSRGEKPFKLMSRLAEIVSEAWRGFLNPIKQYKDGTEKLSSNISLSIDPSLFIIISNITKVVYWFKRDKRFFVEYDNPIFNGMSIILNNRTTHIEYIEIDLLHQQALLEADINQENSRDQLLQCLVRARKANYLEKELESLISLADLVHRMGIPILAREYLEDAWEICERGPYPLFHCDALNLLSQIERDAGNTKSAIKAATKAYELAWCDGISMNGKTCYAYWWGLQTAKKHLEAIGAPIPQLPPFDESKYEPLPEFDWESLGLGDEKN